MKRFTVLPFLLATVVTGFSVAQEQQDAQQPTLLSRIEVGQKVHYANRTVIVLRPADVKSYQKLGSPVFGVREVHRNFIVLEALTDKDGQGSLEIAVAAHAIDEFHRYTGADEKVREANGWLASIISAESLEDEVKQLKLSLDREITNPDQFKRRGFKLAGRGLSELAMLFGIIAEYDGDVRWKKDAPIARDVFSRTARHCKVGTQPVYEEAKLRRQELAELMAGGRLLVEGEPPLPAQADWLKLVDRAPLMQRMNEIYRERLPAALSSDGEFKSNREQLHQMAQVIAAIGAVLGKEGMEGSDDDEYREFTRLLSEQASELATAAEQHDRETASQAVQRLSMTCAKCHESFR